MIDNTFIALASNILGDTDSGLSGREICEYLAEYAVEYNQNLVKMRKSKIY